MKKIIYVTYQTFPAETANSLQTISNIKYLVRNKIDVELMFPLRDKESNSNLETIKKYYSINENFKVTGIKHFLPFGKINIFKSFIFNLSHFIWSWYVVNFKIKKNPDVSFITRSDWILYFLAKKGNHVLFECHQISRTRNYVINKVFNFSNVEIVFLNHNLQKFYDLDDQQSTVLHNGVDEDLFDTTTRKMNRDLGRMIFVGNLKRFNNERGLKFLIDAFNTRDYLLKYKLSIIGGPESYADELRKHVAALNLEKNIEILGRVERSSISKIYQNAHIGILINTSTDDHSYKYTSPLKYFEYIYAGLNVVAVDFPSHRELPGSSNIIYFEENNTTSFELALKKATSFVPDNTNLLKHITLNNRVKRLIDLIN